MTIAGGSVDARAVGRRAVGRRVGAAGVVGDRVGRECGFLSGLSCCGKALEVGVAPGDQAVGLR